ncbi:MAG: hypothetical protein JWQ23_1190, partial [Herminiimonas sp.]|nr:hypothetical protein [Herminiimonas sp.]
RARISCFGLVWMAYQNIGVQCRLETADSNMPTDTGQIVGRMALPEWHDSTGAAKGRREVASGRIGESHQTSCAGKLAGRREMSARKNLLVVGWIDIRHAVTIHRIGPLRSRPTASRFL